MQIIAARIAISGATRINPNGRAENVGGALDPHLPSSAGNTRELNDRTVARPDDDRVVIGENLGGHDREQLAVTNQREIGDDSHRLATDRAGHEKRVDSVIAEQLEKTRPDLLDVIRIGVDSKNRIDDETTHRDRWMLERAWNLRRGTYHDGSALGRGRRRAARPDRPNARRGHRSPRLRPRLDCGLLTCHPGACVVIVAATGW